MNILKIKTPERILGNYGEKAACKYLRRHGYKILRKNFTADSAEIDIIAQNSDTLVFVEVKTRNLTALSPDEPRPASAVNPEKQRKIIKAARVYLAFNPTEKRKQFDIIEVLVDSKNGRYSLAEIKHLKNTFNLNTAFSTRKGNR